MDALHGYTEQADPFALVQPKYFRRVKLPNYPVGENCVVKKLTPDPSDLEEVEKYQAMQNGGSILKQIECLKGRVKYEVPRPFTTTRCDKCIRRQTHADLECIYDLMHYEGLRQLVCYLKPPELKGYVERVKPNYVKRLQFFDRNYTAILMRQEQKEKEEAAAQTKGVEPLPAATASKLAFKTNDRVRENAFRKGVDDMKRLCLQLTSSTHARVIFFAWHHDFFYEGGVEYAHYLDQKTSTCLGRDESRGSLVNHDLSDGCALPMTSNADTGAGNLTAGTALSVCASARNRMQLPPSRQINDKLEEQVKMELGAIEKSVQRIVEFTNRVDQAKAQDAFDFTLLSQRNALLQKQNDEKELELAQLQNLVASARRNGAHEDLALQTATLQTQMLQLQNSMMVQTGQFRRMQQENEQLRKELSGALAEKSQTPRNVSSKRQHHTSTASSSSSSTSSSAPTPSSSMNGSLGAHAYENGGDTPKRTRSGQAIELNKQASVRPQQQSHRPTEFKGTAADEILSEREVTCKMCHVKYPARMYDQDKYHNTTSVPAYSEWTCSGPHGNGVCPAVASLTAGGAGGGRSTRSRGTPGRNHAGGSGSMTLTPVRAGGQ